MLTLALYQRRARSNSSPGEIARRLRKHTEAFLEIDGGGERVRSEEMGQNRDELWVGR